MAGNLEMVDSDEVLDLIETAETIEIIELKKVIKNGKEEIKTITIDTSEIPLFHTTISSRNRPLRLPTVH